MKRWINHEISTELTIALGRLNWQLRKVFAMIGIVLMLGGLIPQAPRALAEPIVSPSEETVVSTPEKPDYPITTDSSVGTADIEIRSEIKSMRTENTKTFLKVDGTYVLAVYGDVVHYQDNGEWIDIDNSLTYDSKNSVYSTKSNAFQVRFPETITSRNQMQIAMNEYAIRWSVSGIANRQILFESSKAASENRLDLPNLNQEIVYQDVQKGVDIEYIVSGRQVKENIILSNYISEFSISFEYEIENLELKLVEGQYVFINSMGDVVFSFTDLYAMDATGDILDELNIHVIKVDANRYLVTLSADNQWLKSAAYPVTIDPTISLTTSAQIYDTYLRSDTSTNYHTATTFYCNTGVPMPSNPGQLAYLNFVVPSYLKDFLVTSASLQLTRYSGTGKVYLHELPSYQTLSSLTWANRPTASTQLIDHGNIGLTSANNTFDITTSVRKWNQQGLTNMPGFQLKSDGGILRFRSMQSSTNKPFITINFIDPNGIKDYWTYNSQDISHAGTGYISDYTQKLIVVRNDLSFSTDLQSFGVSFAFSNQQVVSNTPNIGYGNGWNTNYNLKLSIDASNNLDYTTDYTGNRIYYHPVTSCDDRFVSTPYVGYVCHIAEDGSGNVLVKMYTSSGLIQTYILTNENVKYLFENNYLSQIIDTETDLSITILRAINLDRISKVFDSVGNSIDFEYNLDNNLWNISLSTKTNAPINPVIKKVYYEYFSSTNYLHKVYHLSDYDQNGDLTLNPGVLNNVDHIVRYDHFTTGLLNKAYVIYIDEVDGTQWMGEEARYSYHLGTNQAVSKYESYFNYVKFSEVTYDLSANQTKITDHSGHFVVYSFDRYGHTVMMMDTDANVQCYNYSDIFLNETNPNYKMNHKLMSQASPGKTTINPILNNSFEEEMLGWIPFIQGNTQIDIEFDLGTTGHYSLKISNPNGSSGYVSQSIALNEGVYNLTVDVRNDTGINDAAYVMAGSQLKTIDPSNDPNSPWVKVEFVISISSPNTAVIIKLGNDSLGSVRFDNLQWYQDHITERKNLVDNPSFEHGFVGHWGAVSGSSLTVYSINDGNGPVNDMYEDVLGNTALGLNGSVFTYLPSNYFQLDEGQSGQLLVGGWAHRYSAPSINNSNASTGKAFRIRVKQQVNFQEIEQVIEFDLTYENWQYAYGEITIFDDVDTVFIYFDYQGEGEVLFDNLSVFFVENKTSYEYDLFGRVSEVYSEDGSTYAYAYPVSNDVTMIPSQITQTTDGNTQIIDIESEDNAIISITRNNVKSSPSYNSYGQMISYSLKSTDEQNPITYFTSSTSYTHLSQYRSSTTNEFGNTTNYYTNVITGLMSYIKNAKGVDTNYSYYDDGLLQSVSVVHSGTSSSVSYFYNQFDQLKEIRINGSYSYYIDYDILGRMSTVSVNNETLMTYQYLTEGITENYATDLVTKQIFENGDFIEFIYEQNTQRLIEVKFKSGNLEPLTRFMYQYDSSGRISRYEDLTNEIIEEYQYDSSGNIKKISYGNDDSIDFTYYQDGKIKSIECRISSETSFETEYFHSSYLNLFDSYDKTLFHLPDFGTLEKNYSYAVGSGFDPVGRLQKAIYTLGTSQINEMSVGYLADTSRITSITYMFGGGSSPAGIQYAYSYDSLGNITQEVYLVKSTPTSVFSPVTTRGYYYDSLNQLIRADYREYTLLETEYDIMNRTVRYKYDIRGNLTDIKEYLYGQSETVSLVIPPFSQVNLGWSQANMFYNGSNNYQTLYSLNVGQTPSLVFSYYDAMTQQYIDGMSTTQTSSNLNINVPGYYTRTYQATDYFEYAVNFTIVFKVGNPSTVRVPQSHVRHVYQSIWQDQLERTETVHYNPDGTISSTTIKSLFEYDLQGNPTKISAFKYENSVFDYADLFWEGRQLVHLIAYSFTEEESKVRHVWYTYNDQGIRVSKRIDLTGDGVADQDIRYVLLGNLVQSEIMHNTVDNQSIETYQINYLYDVDGSPVGFEYHEFELDPELYLYVRNLQGDVVKILDSSGNVVVEYEYDAYGNVLFILEPEGSTIGQINSIRYRSYRFDSEINMYYLNSRYYVPELGRFLNADGLLGPVGNILGHNMYAYCANNPVMYTDSDGYSWETFWKATAIVAVVALVIVATVVTITTFGIGSVAATIALSSAISLAARTAEVWILQKRKSVSEGDSSEEVFSDVVGSIFSNAGAIIGMTPLTKAGGYLTGFFDQSWSYQGIKQLFAADGFKLKNFMGSSLNEMGKRITGIREFMSVDATKGSMIIAYGFSAIDVANAVYSYYAYDFNLRASQRGYTLR